MTRGVSVTVIIAMSLMCSFDGHSTAATGYFYEHPIRAFNPPTLSTLRSTGQYDAITAGSKVVASPRPRVKAPPIPSLPPLTSRTTLKPKHTNKQQASTTTADGRSRPAGNVYPRPTVQTQKLNPQSTKKTQAQTTKPSQFQQQPRPPFSQAPNSTQHVYLRQQTLRTAVPTSLKTSLPATSRTALKTSPKPIPNPTPKTAAPKSIPKPTQSLPKPTLKSTPKPTQRLPLGSSATKATPPLPTQKQTPTLAQRPLIMPAPPLPKLPPNSALPQRPVAHVTTQRPTAPPAISRRWSLQKPVQVLNSRPIQASASSSLLQSPDIYVVNGRQLKQYKVYEQIDNDIEQDLGNFIPANFFLHSYHARIGPTHPLGEDVQLQSRFGNQRSQQQSFQQAPTSIALGSGGLGFVRLPNGNVYLGSGSLGYISGVQRTQDVVQARTRTGASAPDATHFGHGPLSDSFYYGSD